MPIVLPNLKPLRRYISDNCDIAIHRMGAIAFTRNGHIVAMGCNKKGDGYVSEFSFHCEEMVLEKSAHFRRTHREKLYILVVRIRGGGDYGLAKPCEGCYQLCQEAGVAGIFYTTVNGIRSL
jgi:hypothetical protein